MTKCLFLSNGASAWGFPRLVLWCLRVRGELGRRSCPPTKKEIDKTRAEYRRHRYELLESFPGVSLFLLAGSSLRFLGPAWPEEWLGAQLPEPNLPASERHSGKRPRPSTLLGLPGAQARKPAQTRCRVPSATHSLTHSLVFVFSYVDLVAFRLWGFPGGNSRDLGFSLVYFTF